MAQPEGNRTRGREGSVRRLLRALFSSVVPGGGQIVGGARRRGLIMLAVVVLLVIGVLVLFLQGVDQALAWLIEPEVLLGLLVLNVILLAFRLYAAIDAYCVRRSPPWEIDELAARQSEKYAKPSVGARVGIIAALIAILVFTVAPHAVAGYYVYLSRDVLTTVFVDDDTKSTSSSVPSTSTAPPTTASTSTTGTTLPEDPTTGGPDTTASTSTTIPPTTTTTQAPPETTPPIKGAEDNRIAVLFLGSDAGYGRTGSRADTIMVATFDLETGRVALFGIPRNTGSVPLTEAAAQALGRKVYIDLISSLYWDARNHPELAAEGQDPGAVVLRDTVSMLLGIPIDYYAVVDMGGFVEVVDALGGVKVNVKERLWVRLSPPTPDEEWKVYDIKPGIQQLSGLEALAFARSRTGSSDYVRMGRQRCVIAALLNQNGTAEMLWRFPVLAQVIKDSVRTDIPIDVVQQLMKIRSDLKTDEMLTVGFTPPKFITGRNEMGYNILDLELVQSTVQQIIEHPEEVVAAEGGDTGVDTSDCWDVD